MTTYWFVLVGVLVLVFAAALAALEKWQDRRPRGVSQADWDRVANEKERARLERAMGKR